MTYWGPVKEWFSFKGSDVKFRSTENRAFTQCMNESGETKNFLYFLAHEQTKVSLVPEDRLVRFPVIDQSVGLISSANSVPLLIPLSRISCKKNINKIRSHEHTNLACGIINLLLDVLLCSIAENFYSLFVFTGESKYGTTLKNTQRYFTTKRLIRYMYSTDMAFTQHKHDKYSLKTKGQKPGDKEIIRHVKLHSDPRQIRGVGDSITISFG